MSTIFEIDMHRFIYAIMQDMGADGDCVYHVYRGNTHIAICETVKEAKYAIKEDYREITMTF